MQFASPLPPQALDASRSGRVVEIARATAHKTGKHMPRFCIEDRMRGAGKGRAKAVFIGGALALGLLAAIAISSTAFAHDIKIEIPKRSHLTPVQRLNRDGVEALRKHEYEKAETSFYKAYLYDPEDPFTLNNLGYISELKGDVQRAHDFYLLATQNASEAVIDRSTPENLRGKSMQAALAVPQLPMQMNHDNVEAVRLLSMGRASEADLLLQQALKHDPTNVFTLNNLGVAKETEGETQDALQLFDTAAASHSNATAVVTLDKQWRGKRVTDMAAQNAKQLRSRMASENTLGAQVALLNLRGVSALNRNDVQTAIRDFRQAYKLDPTNAFVLNNIGYVSELQGDRETAQFYYDEAARAGGANVVVGLATRQSAQGHALFQVADNNNSAVTTQLTVEQEARRRQRAPAVLLRRDNSIVQEPISPPRNTQPQNPPK
jgi:Flp pilus assembly protein TadD